MSKHTYICERCCEVYEIIEVLNNDVKVTRGECKCDDPWI